jgi:hypothetical protein
VAGFRPNLVRYLASLGIWPDFGQSSGDEKYVPTSGRRRPCSPSSS